LLQNLKLTAFCASCYPTSTTGVTRKGPEEGIC